MLGNGVAFKLDIPPGINKDDSPFDASAQWVDGDGFRFVRGKPETIGGAVSAAGATGLVRVAKMLVYDAAGTIKLATAGDTLHIAEFDTAGTNISPAGWPVDNGRRSLAMFGDVLLALPNGGSLYESPDGAQAVAVTNAPTQSTVMLVTPSRQIMLLGTKEEVSATFNSRCIRWCNIEDRTDWTTTPSNNAGEYILPGQEDIVGGCVLGDYVAIWTEGALWLAQFVGDPSQTFVFERVADIGIIGPDAFAVYRQVVYWLGSDQTFYSYQVGGIVQNIPCPMGRWMRDAISSSSAIRGRIWGCSNSRFGEVWFGVPINFATSSFAQECRTYVVFCVNESIAAQHPVWFVGSFGTAGLASACGAMVESPLAWDSGGGYKTQVIAHAFEALGNSRKPFRWDCAAQALGIASSFIQSADFYLDNDRRRMMIRRFTPDFETQGGTVDLTLTFRNRPMSSNVATKGPYSIAVGADKVDFRASGIVVAARFSTASAVRVRFGEPVFELVPEGAR